MVRKYNLAVGTSILERQILFGKEKRIIYTTGVCHKTITTYKSGKPYFWI